MRAARYLRAASIILFASGMTALIMAALSGEVDFGLVLVFPVIWGTGILSAVGIFMIFAGIFLFYISFFFLIPPPVPEYGAHIDDITQESRSHAGGVILIGPIPIVFGSDWKTVRMVIILAIVLVLLLLVLSVAL